MQKTKRMNRGLSMLLALVMILTMLPISTFAANTDIGDHWAEETMLKWSELGWFNGDGAGTYRPNAGITRAEFMVLVNQMQGYTGQYPEMAKYTDVSPDAWYYSAVSAALAAGYVSGTSDSTVSPEKNITRQEAMTIIAHVAGVSASDTSILAAVADGNQVADWAKATVAACINEGFVAGSDGKINPTSNITRAESVVLLDKIHSNVRTYAFAGTYGPASGTATVAAVNIIGAGVTLRNMTVAGDVTIASSVGNGDAHLNDIEIGGSLLVEGGGKNSIFLADVRVEGSVIVRKYEGENVVRIVVSGDCNFNAVVLRTGTILVTQQLADGTVINVEIPADYLAGSKFEFIGAFDNITNNGSNTDLNIIGSVNTLTLNGSADVSGTGKIGIANVSEAAGKDTSFERKPTSLTGDGKDDVTLPTTGSTGSGGSGSGGGGGNRDVALSDVPALTDSVDHNEAFTLPTAVDATLSGGGTKSFAVTWSPSTADTSLCGTFTFEGTLTMTSGYSNPDNLKAQLTLTVAPVLESIAITQAPAKTLYLEDEALDLTGLVVTATYSSGDSHAVTVTADDVSGFDSTQADGTAQTLTITYEGKTAAFTVTVYPAATGTIQSITNPAAITLPNGTAQTAFPLPAYVVITVDDSGSNVDTVAAATWHLYTISYDAELKTAQSFTVPGSVALPNGVDNNDDIALETAVDVTVSEAVYAVTFSLNGQTGAAVASQSVAHGATAAAPADPSAVSHNFTGWYTTAACDTAWDFTADTVTDDITLYAGWEIKTFTVSFDANGTAAAMPASQTVDYGSTATKPADPVLDGSSFAGWYTDSACETAYVWTAQVTGNVTLYAKFADTLSMAKDALTFDTIKGGNTSEQSIMTNLSLPASLLDYPGISISWATTNRDVITIGGIVTRPEATEADASVKLTATLTAGSSTLTKEFQLLVRKQGVSEVEVTGTDTRFAPGYPVVSFDADGKATLKLKLDAGVATDASPVSAYIVFDTRTGAYYTLDKESILYGHSVGKTENAGGKHAVWPVSEVFELTLTGDEEVSVVSTSIWHRSTDSYKIGVVLLAEDNQSDPLSTATVITLTAEEVNYVDVTPPSWFHGHLSEDGKTIYLYADEKLSTASGNIPDPRDFDILGVDGITVTGVQIETDTSTSSGYMPGCITLTLSGAITSGTEDVLATYTPNPHGNKLADASSNEVVNPITNIWVNTQAPAAKLFVNPTEGTALVLFEGGLHHWSEYANHSKWTSLVSINYKGAPQTLKMANNMWSTDETEVLYTFEPLPAGNYSPSDFTLDIDAGLTFWSHRTVVVTDQPAEEVLPSVTTAGISAQYDSTKKAIVLTLPVDMVYQTAGGSRIGNTSAVACSFRLFVDGERQLYRDETTSYHYGLSVQENELILPLNDRLAAAIEAGGTVTLTYAPDDAHTENAHAHLADYTGAYLPNFGPVTVSK